MDKEMQGQDLFLKRIWIGFLILCTTFNGLRGFNFTVDTPIDFKNLYLGAMLWKQQQNPYDDPVIKAAWLEVCARENISPDHPPGLPANLLIYPPPALMFYSFFSFFSWKMAVAINFVLCLCGLFLFSYFTYLLLKKNTGISLGHVMLVTLGLTGSIPGVFAGQPSFIGLPFSAGALYLVLHKNQKMLGGLLLGIAFFKPPIAVPFFVFLLYKKQWRAAICSLVAAVAFFFLAISLYDQSAELVKSFRTNLDVLKVFIFYTEGNYAMANFTELGMIIEFFIKGSYEWHPIFYTVLLLVSLLIVFSKRSRLSDVYIYSILMLLSILIGYHLRCDVIMVLPILFLQASYARHIRYMLVAVSIPLFLPINDILLYLGKDPHTNILFYLTPFFLLLMLVTALWKRAYIRNYR